MMICIIRCTRSPVVALLCCCCFTAHHQSTDMLPYACGVDDARRADGRLTLNALSQSHSRTPSTWAYGSILNRLHCHIVVLAIALLLQQIEIYIPAITILNSMAAVGGIQQTANLVFIILPSIGLAAM
eukprot:scaffold109458_cov49-Prasinocladus_malaysianus.AAC.2